MTIFNKKVALLCLVEYLMLLIIKVKHNEILKFNSLHSFLLCFIKKMFPSSFKKMLQIRNIYQCSIIIIIIIFKWDILNQFYEQRPFLNFTPPLSHFMWKDIKENV